MNDSRRVSGWKSSLWLLPLKILAWPFIFFYRLLYEKWISYLFGRVVRDEHRVYSVRFIWYGDSVYLHPMVWGSVVLFFVIKSEVFAPGWPLLTWFILLAICFLTVIYNFNIVKAGVLIACITAVFSLAHISSLEYHWNPLRAVANHISWLEAEVTPGFYIASAYVFTMLIAAEVLWAWMFNRVELDQSYIYEHRFMQAVSREPIFARGLKRETKDLLELLILGAADIKHQTRDGYKVYKNVPAASLGLGTAIDKLLDFRRPEEIEMERQRAGGSGRSRSGRADTSMPDQMQRMSGEGDL
jgi:hypothetical protein